MNSAELKDRIAKAQQQVAPAVTDILRRLVAMNDPLLAAGCFTHGVLANIVGNMPDEYWDLMRLHMALPCDVENCQCHELGARMSIVLDEIRQDWKEWKRILIEQG